MKKTILTLVTLFTFSLGLFAQTNPVQWSFKAIETGKNTYDLVISADIDDEWCVYSQFLESEDGPIPTSFTFDTNTSMKLIGEVQEVGKKEEAFDKLFDMKIAKFKHHVEFVQKIKTKSDNKSITGFLNFMTCNGKTCLPPTEVTFEIQL